MNKFHIARKVRIKEKGPFHNAEGIIKGIFLYELSDKAWISYRIEIPSYGITNVDEVHLEYVSE